MFDFDLVTGPVVNDILRNNRTAVIDIVRDAYVAHRAGSTVNPDSYFLRFPDKPAARIIALPAFLGGDVGLAGIKWISSFPENITRGAPRASAVLVLNDYATGYPIACLEAATISAARTAASAALAARTLRPEGYASTAIAVLGAGVIARNICDYLLAIGCRPSEFVIYDLHEASSRALADYLSQELGQQASIAAGLADALSAETVVLATTAAKPYIDAKFAPGQLVLNISLRDLAPEVVLAATNIVDDVDHCLKADTSPHLAEQLSGSRDFVTGTLADILTGALDVPGAGPVVFSPFGMGVLDLAVGAYVHKRARAAGTALAVPEFFAETSRW
ncbi:2,3-diaminopropionate biosynthesis protein SbnB [Nocardia brasiliensis]|uniref:2,3-diaminopropionate biosynthesis protein SbnB n=1 Tax=Nocardia brasiliensis TaxID=37326 RepID=A0A6G9XTT2_NOCBR|nr:2,3-diaminopropionate biosynthesis protein SbnB [Nocardia brasiliensis]QIS04250.1 2,3-diaminopropionate biosynthesis protein SbnB [Nocardia brasiliensis]